MAPYNFSRCWFLRCSGTCRGCPERRCGWPCRTRQGAPPATERAGWHPRLDNPVWDRRKSNIFASSWPQLFDTFLTGDCAFLQHPKKSTIHQVLNRHYLPTSASFNSSSNKKGEKINRVENFHLKLKIKSFHPRWRSNDPNKNLTRNFVVVVFGRFSWNFWTQSGWIEHL